MCGGVFDESRLTRELTDLETQIASPDFWKDQQGAQRTLQKRRRLEDERTLAASIRKQVDDLAVLFDWARSGEDVAAELGPAMDAFTRDVQSAEIRTMLSGELDRKGAIITIHPGAGGTESQDWAEMLMRMYTRWTERRGFSREVVDLQPGDEAGIKSATIVVGGDYAYGLLAAEAGVHRLVRISPFDQAARRHTSFASLYVWPELEDDIDIEINESEIRIDTYRASGAGGQHVNTTDSAVRITHIPTGIVVACQNERSQHKNRASAFKQLKARLYEAELQKREAEASAANAAKTDIGWGHQIRSYVLQPYQLVKDLRTGVTSTAPMDVLDGDLDRFMAAALSQRVTGEKIEVEDVE